MLSPNGRWLAYVSDRTGRFEVYVRPFPNTVDWLRQISSGGGWEPRWSHDGTGLFYLNGNDELVRVEILEGDVFVGDEHRVLFSMIGVWDYEIQPDDRRFVLIRERDSERPGGMIVIQNLFEELRRSTQN